MKPRLPQPCLCLVTDRRSGSESNAEAALRGAARNLSREARVGAENTAQAADAVADAVPLVDRVAAAVAGGVNLVQLREKDLSGGALLTIAASLASAIGDGALLLVNERVDVAAALPADGVQLGEEALPTAAARRILGPNALLGRSVHSVSAAIAAAEAGADFLVAGTMYASRSHPGGVVNGPQLIREIVRHTDLPVLGIGGVTAVNAPEIMAAGAAGVAVISGILADPAPAQAARRLKTALVGA